MQPYYIGISPDFRTAAAGLLEPVLTEILDPLPHIEYGYFETEGDTVAAHEIAHCDAVITLAKRFDTTSLAGNDRLAVIARWGVGYDMIDVDACTEAGVLLAITVDAVRKPVAEAILTFFLALAKRLPAKDKLVRSGRWDLRPSTSGLGLSGKTVGSVGLGNIAGEMFRLLHPFDLGRKLAADPYGDPKMAQQLGVEMVDLPTLFSESDFIAVNCLLNDETQGLINGDLFRLMKPTAYFVNTARGPIVNQADLTAALQAGQFAGAGLDVFEVEPLPMDHPLAQMENVILSPHGMAWTDDLYHGNGVGACENVLAVLRGEIPQYTVNRAVVRRPKFQDKLS